MRTWKNRQRKQKKKTVSRKRGGGDAERQAFTTALAAMRTAAKTGVGYEEAKAALKVAKHKLKPSNSVFRNAKDTEFYNQYETEYRSFIPSASDEQPPSQEAEGTFGQSNTSLGDPRLRGNTFVAPPPLVTQSNPLLGPRTPGQSTRSTPSQLLQTMGAFNAKPLRPASSSSSALNSAESPLAPLAPVAETQPESPLAPLPVSQPVTAAELAQVPGLPSAGEFSSSSSSFAPLPTSSPSSGAPQGRRLRLDAANESARVAPMTIQQCQEQLAALRAQFEALKAENASKVAEISGLQEANKTQLAKNANMREELARVETTLAAAQEGLEEKELDKEAALAKVASISGELKRLEQEVGGDEGLRSRLASAVATLEATRGEKASLDEILDGLRKVEGELNSQLESLRGDLAAAAVENQRLEAEKGQLAAEKAGELGRVVAELKSAEEKAQRLEGELKESKELSAAEKAEKAGLNDQLAALRASIAEEQKKFELAQQELGQVKQAAAQESARLNELVQKTQREFQAATAESQAKQEALQRLEVEKATAEQKFAAQEDALSAVREEKAALAASQAASEEQLEQLRGQKEAAQAEVQAAQAALQLATAEQRAAAQQKAAEAAAALQALNSRLQQQELAHSVDMEKKNESAARLASTIQRLQTELARYEGGKPPELVSAVNTSGEPVLRYDAGVPFFLKFERGMRKGPLVLVVYEAGTSNVLESMFIQNSSIEQIKYEPASGGALEFELYDVINPQ